MGSPARGHGQPGSLGTVPRPAPGSVPEEEGVLPVSAEFLSVSPQACPQPFQVGVRLRSRSSPSDLQRAGRGGEDKPRTLWELVLETWAPGDVARATLVLGGRAGSSRLHCLEQEWSRKGAQASLHHCHQGKPSSVTEPDMIRILPKASLSFALQPDQE